MALNFSDTKGSAVKNGEYFKLKAGQNVFRIVGGILPRYLYWVKRGKDNVPFECLSFDRSLEKFTNTEKDWVQERVTVKNSDTGKMEPIKCGWAYACLVLDPEDDKLKILNLKKKMFEQIIATSKKLGDPTDPDAGYAIVVDRIKTGAHAYNVEYTLDVLEMSGRGSSALTDEQKELVANAEKIDVQVPRVTSDEQKVALDKYLSGGDPTESSEPAANLDKEAIDDI